MLWNNARQAEMAEERLCSKALLSEIRAVGKGPLKN